MSKATKRRDRELRDKNKALREENDKLRLAAHRLLAQAEARALFLSARCRAWKALAKKRAA